MALPVVARNWTQQIAEHNLNGKTIHDLGAGPSASKFGLPQFLLLRVLVNPWVDTDTLHKICSRGDGPLSKKFLKEAEEILGGCKPFKKYLDSFEDQGQEDKSEAWGPKYDSSFSLVRYYQHLSSKVTSEVAHTPKVEVSPRRTRSQAARAIPASPTTPTPNPTAPDETRVLHRLQGLLLGPSEGADDDTPSSSSFFASPPYEADPPVQEFEAAYYKTIEDEQIVNTALVLFLNALTIHDPKIKAEWTLTRAAFVMKDSSGQKLYEARVDGLLRPVGSTEARIIIEVKPHMRGDRNTSSEIQMQEAAQLAAWIYQSPPKAKPNSGKHTRLLVSQDRHEVYVTVASFTDSYVEYLRQQRVNGAFMELQTYGPYHVNLKLHMEELGCLMLGFTLQEGQ